MKTKNKMRRSKIFVCKKSYYVDCPWCGCEHEIEIKDNKEIKQNDMMSCDNCLREFEIYQIYY